MKAFLILSIAFTVCCGRPDVSHLTNNGYLLPAQTNHYEAPVYNTGSANAESYTPKTGLNIPLQQIQGQTTQRHARIESIRPSIHIASFSVRTTVPLTPSYTQTQQSHSFQAPLQQSYYAPAAVHTTSNRDSYNYNAPTTFTENAPAPAPQTYESAAPIGNTPSQQQSYTTPQTYLPPAPVQQYGAPPPPAVQHNYEPPATSQQYFDGPQQAFTPPAATQQSYLPPAPAQHSFAPRNPVQEDNAEQSFLPRTVEQETYTSPATLQQTFVPPAPAQDTYQPPTHIQKAEAPAPLLQTYSPPSQAQQTYTPATVQQSFVPPATAQYSYTPQAPVQQSYAAPPAVQSYNEPAPAQQTYVPPGTIQQSYTTAADFQQAFVPPPPVQQSYTPHTEVHHNYASSPPQQTFSPPSPVQQTAEIVQEDDTLVTTPEVSENFAGPTLTSARETEEYLPPAPLQHTMNHYSNNQASYSYQTTSQQTFTKSSASQQNDSPVIGTPRHVEQSYSPPAPMKTQNSAQQVYSVPTPVSAQQAHNSVASRQQAYSTPNQVQHSFSPEVVQQSYLPPAPTKSAAPAQPTYTTLQPTRQSLNENSIKSQVKQAQPEQPTATHTPEDSSNYNQQIQEFVASEEHYAVPEKNSPASKPSQGNTESHQGLFNYKQPSAAPVSKTSVEGSYNYKPTNIIQPIKLVPAHMTHSFEISSSYNPTPTNFKAPTSTTTAPVQPTPTPVTQNYALPQTTSNVDAYNYRAPVAQQNNKPFQSVELHTTTVSNQQQNNQPNSPAHNSASAPQSYAPPAPAEMFSFIPKSIMQLLNDFNFRASDGENAEIQSPHVVANQAPTQSRESTKLTPVQPTAKTEQSSHSQLLPIGSSTGTEYGSNGGYVYRRNR